MITFLAGKKSKALDAAIEKAILESGATDVYRRDATTEAFETFYDDVQSPSLFGEKFVFVVTNLFEDDAIKKTFLNNGEELAQASHDIVVLLDSILAADTKKAEAFATVAKIADPKTAGVAYNAFALANAFATGDKKKAWVTFQELLSHEDEMEKTHGMVWWKLKDTMQKRSPVPKPVLNEMARALWACITSPVLAD